MVEGMSLSIAHHGEPVTLTSAEPAVLPIPAMAAPGKRPAQPPGREPQGELVALEEADESRAMERTGHTRQ